MGNWTPFCHRKMSGQNFVTLFEGSQYWMNRIGGDVADFVYTTEAC